MDEWRLEFRKVIQQFFTEDCEFLMCENPTQGDYYTNIALRVARSGAYETAMELQKALKSLEVMFVTQVSKQGFINIFLSADIKRQILMRWQDEPFVENAPLSIPDLHLLYRLHVLFEQWDWQPFEVDAKLLIGSLKHPLEKRLLCFVGQFDEMIRKTTQTLEWNIFNNYLKHIARETESYYNVVILNDENLNIRSARYLLLKAIKNVLKYGIACLGIENPERIKCQDNNM